MNVPATLAALVKERAERRCEYCRMSQSLQGATFHVEHIIPLTCGGSTTEDNLALACPSCNLHKSDRSHAVDPDTRETALDSPFCMERRAHHRAHGNRTCIDSSARPQSSPPPPRAGCGSTVRTLPSKSLRGTEQCNHYRSGELRGWTISTSLAGLSSHQIKRKMADDDFILANSPPDFVFFPAQTN